MRLEKAIWESNEFVDYASAVINGDISVLEEVYGDYAEDTPIDRISEIIVEDVVAVKCDNVELQEYTVYLIVQLYTESYFDHEFFPNKVISGYMSIYGVMQEDLIKNAGVPFEKRNVNWIGRLPNVVSYGLFHDYTEKSLQRSIFNREEHNGDEEE